jgi:ribose 5-phosphate isomerase B
MQEDEIQKLVRKAVHKALGLGESNASTAGSHKLTGRKLITETDIQDLAPGAEVEIPADALVTPLARDLIGERRLRLVSIGPAFQTGAAPAPNTIQQAGCPEKNVALGADHGGFALKENLKKYLQELGYTVLDCGTFGSEAVDYPDFAYAVARLVAEGRASRGIVVDGAGIGSCMVANKVPGIRAAMCHDISTAINSREHNNANVLTLGGGLLGSNLAQQIVKAWLTTEFGGGRHARRVDKIMAIEQRYLRK